MHETFKWLSYVHYSLNTFRIIQSMYLVSVWSYVYILWIYLGLFKVCTLFLWQISPRHSWQCMQFPGFSASNLPLLWHFVVAVTYFANCPFHTLSPCSVILSLGGPTLLYLFSKSLTEKAMFSWCSVSAILVLRRGEGGERGQGRKRL